MWKAMSGRPLAFLLAFSDRTARIFVAILLAFSVIYSLTVWFLLVSTQFKMGALIGNQIAVPLFANFSNPKMYGLHSAEAFFIDGKAGKLGAWFVRSASLMEPSPVYLLYLHGQSGSRALGHRVELLNRTSEMGFHVLAVDYRGFADSDGWPNESGMVEDSISAYMWIREKASVYPIYIWGHSLGASIALQLASWISENSLPLNGVILDAPFNNFTDAVLLHPLFLPAKYFVPDVQEYFSDVKLSFRNDLWIRNVTSPILMLHGRGDLIIHVECARKLYRSSLEGRSHVKYVEFDEAYSHNDLMRATDLPAIISNFRKETS